MKTTVTRDTGPITRFLNYATGAAAVLAITAALAAPAFADRRSDDFAKALAALAAIAIIANQIDKSNDKPKPQPVRHPRVPAVCALDIDIADGQGRYFSENCMREEGIKARLPQDCARRAEIYGRTDRIYPEWCLREAGFRTRGQ